MDNYMIYGEFPIDEDETEPLVYLSDILGMPAKSEKTDNTERPVKRECEKVKCIDAIDSAVVGLPPDQAVCVASVIKHLWRFSDKNSEHSLNAAKWYLDRLIGKVCSGKPETLKDKKGGDQDGQ